MNVFLGIILAIILLCFGLREWQHSQDIEQWREIVDECRAVAQDAIKEAEKAVLNLEICNEGKPVRLVVNNRSRVLQ